MNTYVVLVNLTDTGVARIGDSPARMARVGEWVAEAGGQIKATYLTMGECDFVVIFEMPDDMAMARLLLRIGGIGSVRTRSMRAFDEADYARILEGLG